MISSATRFQGDFHLLDGNKVQVDYMHSTRRFKFFEDNQLDVQYLEIDYINNGASFLVILPRQKTGLRQLESRLTGDVFEHLRTGAKSDKKVSLKLPKFKTESNVDLKKLLLNVGITEIFDEKAANLSGIAGINPDKRLFVSAAYHKTFIGEFCGNVPVYR